MAEARIVKFCTQVPYIILSPSFRMTNRPKGVVVRVVFNFDARNHISGTAKASVAITP